ALRRVNPWYVAGGALTAWALVVSALGITRPGFPGSTRGARVVMMLSVLLVAAAIAAAVFGAAEEAKEREHEGAALALPR
nr:hypothetical protein [Actinomycetota bacterium]